MPSSAATDQVTDGPRRRRWRHQAPEAIRPAWTGRARTARGGRLNFSSGCLTPVKWIPRTTVIFRLWRVITRCIINVGTRRRVTISERIAAVGTTGAGAGLPGGQLEFVGGVPYVIERYIPIAPLPRWLAALLISQTGAGCLASRG